MDAKKLKEILNSMPQEQVDEYFQNTKGESLELMLTKKALIECYKLIPDGTTSEFLPYIKKMIFYN